MKNDVNKFVDSLGKGLQAAGGEVSFSRAGATLLHAGASMIGFEEKTKEMLDKSVRPNVTLTDADLADLDEKKKNMAL